MWLLGEHRLEWVATSLESAHLACLPQSALLPSASLKLTWSIRYTFEKSIGTSWNAKISMSIKMPECAVKVLSPRLDSDTALVTHRSVTPDIQSLWTSDLYFHLPILHVPWLWGKHLGFRRFTIKLKNSLYETSLPFYIFRSMNGVAIHTDAEINKTGENKKQHW